MICPDCNKPKQKANPIFSGIKKDCWKIYGLENIPNIKTIFEEAERDANIIVNHFVSQKYCVCEK